MSRREPQVCVLSPADTFAHLSRTKCKRASYFPSAVTESNQRAPPSAACLRVSDKVLQ